MKESPLLHSSVGSNAMELHEYRFRIEKGDGPVGGESRF